RPRMWAWLYVGSTCIAGYLHFVTLAFTLVPFAHYGAIAIYGVAARATRSEHFDKLRQLFLLGSVTVVPLAIALLPPAIVDAGTVAEKAGAHSVTLESFYRTLLTLFGLANPVPLAVAMALTGWGIKRVWERDRDLTRYWVVVCAVGIVAVAAARPMWVQHPLVLARYSLPRLPFI